MGTFTIFGMGALVLAVTVVASLPHTFNSRGYGQLPNLFGNEPVFVVIFLILFLCPLVAAYCRFSSFDFSFVSALLLIPAAFLILLRNTPQSMDPFLVGLGYLAWIVTLALWLGRSLPQTRFVQGGGHLGLARTRLSFGQILGVSSLLIGFAVITFYIPLRQHFWIGWDEGMLLMLRGRPLWQTFFDTTAGRPLPVLGAMVALTFSPNTVDGFLWLSLGLRLCTALVIYALVQSYFKGSRVLAMVAALLYIVNPSEVLRFAALHAITYPTAVFCLVLALWLYILSYEYSRRWLLAAACVLLGLSLLQFEIGYPVALLAVALIRLKGRRLHFSTWCYAWCGTAAVLAVRFVTILLGYSGPIAKEGLASFLLTNSGAYQTRFLGGSDLLARFVQNFIQDLLPVLSYVQSSGTIRVFPLVMFAGIALVGLLQWTTSSHAEPIFTRRMYAVALLVVGLALVLSIVVFLPYVPLPTRSGQDNPTLRTQFYAAPIQAILWTLCIGLVATFIPARWRRLWMTVSTSILVALAVSSSLQFQARNGSVNPAVDYEKTRRIFQQVQSLTPALPPDTAILFILDDKAESPLGFNYHLFDIACLTLGSPAYQGKFVDDGWQVRTKDVSQSSDELPYRFTFDRAVAFNLSADGTVTKARLPQLHPGAASKPGPTQCAQLVTIPENWPPMNGSFTAFQLFR